MAVLELENLSYTYSPGTPYEMQAVKQISYKFREKGITGIIGHTGSGKSTLVQMFNALLKPTSGRVLLDGYDINSDRKKLKSIRSRIGLVFQYPEYQLFSDTVYDDIAFGPRNLGLSEEEVKERVDFAAEFSLVDNSYYKKSPFDLSGGQKRRVAIAGVLAMKPDILVLDEPVAGLDPRGKNKILCGLRKLADEQDISVIIVSHSMDDMALFADDILVLNRGSLMISGDTRSVFSKSDKLISYGLGLPQIVDFLISLKRHGVSVPDGLYTLDDVYSYLSNLLLRKEDKV